MDDSVRLLLVTFPVQGQINPSLQFAKRLVKMGVNVTFVTAFSALNRIAKSTSTAPQGLTFFGFSDGFDDGSRLTNPMGNELDDSGPKAIAGLIKSEAERGQPFVHLVYTTFLPWVAKVARALHVPSTFLWIQPATILNIYYRYFNGYREAIRNPINNPSSAVELPGLPLLACSDIPSFLLDANTIQCAPPLFSSLKEHVEILDAESNPRVLYSYARELKARFFRSCFSGEHAPTKAKIMLKMSIA